MGYGKDFAALYNRRWQFWGHKMWPFLHKLVRRETPRASKWLDLCCGAGSLLKPVTRAGFQAVGVDASTHQLAHAAKNAPAATLRRADIRRFRPAEKFDVITCLFDSLNYLTSPADLSRVFRNVRRMLSGGGLFVFDVNTIEGLRRNWNNRTSTMRLPGLLVVIETSFDPKRLLASLIFTGFAKSGKTWRQWVDRHLERGYPADEIERMLRRAGLTCRKLDGNTLGKARKSSGRLLFVCWKVTAGKRHAAF